MSLRRTFENREIDTTDSLPNLDSGKVKKSDRMKLERMRHRNERKMYLMYPEDRIKQTWDMFITLILLVSCMLTPYRIAFGDIEEPLEWKIINFSIDALFLIDIFVIFNSAFYDDEFIIVEDRKQIARKYLGSWFIIDLVAIIPFDLLISQDENFQDIIRFAKIGKISKLIKMTRLLRILKIVKQRSQLLKYLNDVLKIGLGFERLIFFGIIFVLLCHVLTCLWVIASQFKDVTEEEEGSWIDDYKGLSNSSLYITSIYFTITTITTVGYGDINGGNTLERCVAIGIMILGVISFSFATGSLSSILSNYDQANAKLQERIAIVNRVSKGYFLPLELYERLRMAIKYDYNKDKNDINQFVNDLPHKLKLEVSLYIHEQTYKRIDLFKGKSSAFIAWVCPLLKSTRHPEK